MNLITVKPVEVARILFEELRYEECSVEVEKYKYSKEVEMDRHCTSPGRKLNL